MIIISPAKDFDLEDLQKNNIELNFENKTLYLVDLLKNKSSAELMQILKVSDKIASQTQLYYRHLGQYTKPAIKLFNGVAFKEINNYNYQYIRGNVFILDALYGIINGNDLISPYRLDFLAKKFDNINLYSYWQDAINTWINNLNPSFILNLASNEFAKLLNPEILNINIFDLEIKSNKKPSSTLLKKIRGSLVDLSIEKQITNIEDYNNYNNKFIDNINVDLLNNKLIVTLKEKK